MYIYIFEDGEIRKGTIFDEEEAKACDGGFLDIIDISGDEPKMYYDGKWNDIEKIE